MIEKKIVFVILHYMAVGVTIECVKHIKEKIDTDSFQIIIVDNNSPDDSYAILQKEYQSNPKITLIHNESNLGFSKGNNVGIRYATDHYKFEFLAVLNNDAFLLETSFYEKIKKYYLKYEFAVAGPRIIDEYGQESNPVGDRLPSDDEINKKIEREQKIIAWNRRHLLVLYLKYCEWRQKLESVNKVLRNRVRKVKVINEVKTDVVLHGSFWIFSKVYFKNYVGLTEKEFLFAEEPTLLYQIKQKNLISLYIPDILVLHLEDMSTDAVYKKEIEKLLFISEQKVKSWQEYLRMKDEREN